jgi:ABC-2 type transport system ATP-binding protein
MEKAVIVHRLVKDFEVVKREKGLIKNFSSILSPKKKIVHALKSISFTIEKGELVGFIGPNGAGKTTALKILSGLLYPTSGFTEVLEYDPWERKPDFLKKIALVMGQKNQLWWDLPAIETFELNRAIYGIPKRQYQETLNELLELLEVKNLINTQVRRLSLGQRMRMELVAALIHKPEILFLDEPTIGLDLVAQQKVRDFIYEYNKKFSSTILLTSHNMGDLVNLAGRVIVINEGQLIFDGKLEALTEHFAKEKILKISLSQESDIKRFEEIGRVLKISFPQITISVPREAAAVAAAEILQDFPVADLTIEEVPIEDVVRGLFKKGATKIK